MESKANWNTKHENDPSILAYEWNRNTRKFRRRGKRRNEVNLFKRKFQKETTAIKLR